MKNPEILKMVSHHYQTGQSLPDDLIQSLLKMRTYDTGFQISRQLWLANFSLHCFNNGPDVDLEALRKKLFDTFITGIQYNSDDHHYAAFGHLTNYGARYYGYLWSEIFRMICLARSKRRAAQSSSLAAGTLIQLLVEVANKDANEMLKDFLGRDPNQIEFLKNMGF